MPVKNTKSALPTIERSPTPRSHASLQEGSGSATFSDIHQLSAFFPATSENKKGPVFPSGTFMESRESALRGLTSYTHTNGFSSFILN